MLRPLFTRLCDPGRELSPQDRHSYRTLVLEDIQRLLSTRYTGTASKELNIVNYGIPSSVGFSSDSSPEKAVLARYIREAIEEYEPRLRNVSVDFAADTDWKSDRFRISATIEYGESEERFSFTYDMP